MVPMVPIFCLFSITIHNMFSIITSAGNINLLPATNRTNINGLSLSEAVTFTKGATFVGSISIQSPAFFGSAISIASTIHSSSISISNTIYSPAISVANTIHTSVISIANTVHASTISVQSGIYMAGTLSCGNAAEFNNDVTVNGNLITAGVLNVNGLSTIGHTVITALTADDEIDLTSGSSISSFVLLELGADSLCHGMTGINTEDTSIVLYNNSDFLVQLLHNSTLATAEEHRFFFPKSVDYELPPYTAATFVYKTVSTHTNPRWCMVSTSIDVYSQLKHLRSNVLTVSDSTWYAQAGSGASTTYTLTLPNDSTTNASGEMSSPQLAYGIYNITNTSIQSVSELKTSTGQYNDGDIVVLINNKSSGTITLVNNASTLTSGAKKILTGTQSSLTLANQASIILCYIASSNAWSIVGGSGSGSGGVTKLSLIHI